MSAVINLCSKRCFNSRTPGGVRRVCAFLLFISFKFQFTHPGRGATESGCVDGRRPQVSIHAPREGCDQSVALQIIQLL